ISVIFINNGIYGMTGGQMAPTTLIGQRSTTSVEGRTREQAGMPLKMCEILAAVPCAVYVERVMLNNPANVRKAKKAVETALDIQKAGLGFTFVEFLSACPTNWGLAPTDALKWVETDMAAYYPIGNFRKPEGY
ncbi:MAG: 2-oxoglutarate oxidoreductase, partial [Ruminococcaceae bacterium]|nr:2-oxoglutarate oxidoreductase [Oscillospiraceae bacterium]